MCCGSRIIKGLFSSIVWLWPFQTGQQVRRAVVGLQVRLSVLRGVGLPGLRLGAARVSRGRPRGEARDREEPAGEAALHQRGEGGREPVLRQLQRAALRRPGQSHHRQVLPSAEQEEGANAHPAQGLQDILTT